MYVRANVLRSVWNPFEVWDYPCDWTLQELDERRIERRLVELYPNGRTAGFDPVYERELDRIAGMAAKFDARLVFVIPPTLLGQTPGHDRLTELLEGMRDRRGIPFFDFSTAIEEIRYFDDPNHLNASGVDHFAREYLRAALKPL